MQLWCDPDLRHLHHDIVVLEVVSAGDFLSAMDLILGTGEDAEASAGSWLRLLAWSLLADVPGRRGEAERRYATLDLLPGMLPEREQDAATRTTAVALALIFGWRFFHPYIRAALHLDDASFAELHEAIRETVRKIARD